MFLNAFLQKTSTISKHASFIYDAAISCKIVYYSILSVAVCLQRKEDTIWQKGIEFIRTDYLNLYFADLLQQFVTEKGYNIYGSKLLKFPNPRFVVFYNGDDSIPERSVLKLSDSFENKEKSGCLEVEALLVDVNVGKNLELMKSCGYLKDYTTFVGKVKEYKEHNDLEVAIDKAMEYCIRHDIMKELLLKHKAEVARLIFREFDEAEYIRMVEKDTENRIAAYQEEIALQKEQLSQKDELLEKYRCMLKEQGVSVPEE